MKYCIGVDLGGTNIAIGLIDLDGKVILQKKSIKSSFIFFKIFYHNYILCY